MRCWIKRLDWRLKLDTEYEPSWKQYYLQYTACFLDYHNEGLKQPKFGLFKENISSYASYTGNRSSIDTRQIGQFLHLSQHELQKENMINPTES